MTSIASPPAAITASAIAGSEATAGIRFAAARAACELAQAIGRGAVANEIAIPLERLAGKLTLLGVKPRLPVAVPPVPLAPAPVSALMPVDTTVPPTQQQAPVLTSTSRECEVLERIAEGHSNAEIGRQLHVTEHTVKTHLRRLYHKIGANDRSHAVAIGFRAGVLSCSLSPQTTPLSLWCAPWRVPTNPGRSSEDKHEAAH